MYFVFLYEFFFDGVCFFYEGRFVRLSVVVEEVVIFYGRMLDYEYIIKEVFWKNFFNDW